MRDVAFRDQIDAILRLPVEVVVIATMKAGKSTLINALLGTELLPSNIEACTARIIKIEDRDGTPAFRARSVGYAEASDWTEATQETLWQFNLSETAGHIEIQGDIPFVRNLGAQLVIYDTPGPNNSQDERHGQRTREILQNGRYGLVLYLMDATQLGASDDASLLKLLREVTGKASSPKKIVFVITKADRLDHEKGETLSGVVARLRPYLEEQGFDNPVIVPVSAYAALLSRKALLGHKLTRRERSELNNRLADHAESPERLVQAALVDRAVLQRLRTQAGHARMRCVEPTPTTDGLAAGEWSRGDLTSLIHWSGIGILESLLEAVLVEDGLPRTLRDLTGHLEYYGASQLARWLTAINE